MTDQLPAVDKQLTLLRLAARVDGYLRQAVADVEDHIDAQQAEIARLRDIKECWDEVPAYWQRIAATWASQRKARSALSATEAARWPG